MANLADELAYWPAICAVLSVWTMQITSEQDIHMSKSGNETDPFS